MSASATQSGDNQSAMSCRRRTVRHCVSWNHVNCCTTVRKWHLKRSALGGRPWRSLSVVTNGTIRWVIYHLRMLHFVWGVAEAKCILATAVCVSACLPVCLSLTAFPRYCTDPDVTWGSVRGCRLVVQYWAYLQSVHEFRCYDNIAPNAKCQRVLVVVLCLVTTVSCSKNLSVWHHFRDITTLRTWLPVTLRSPSFSIWPAQVTYTFRFVFKHRVHNSGILLEVWEIERIQTAKSTFKVTHVTLEVGLDCRLTIASPVYGRQISPRIGLVRGHVTRSEFLGSNHISGTANARVKFCSQVRYVKC